MKVYRIEYEYARVIKSKLFGVRHQQYFTPVGIATTLTQARRMARKALASERGNNRYRGELRVTGGHGGILETWAPCRERVGLRSWDKVHIYQPVGIRIRSPQRPAGATYEVPVPIVGGNPPSVV